VWTDTSDQDTFYTLGGTSDTWSCTAVSTAAVKNTAFGVKMTADKAGGATPLANSWHVDEVQVTIEYTEVSNNDPTITSINDTPDPVSLGSSISFPFDWNDDDAGEFIKAKLCSSSNFTNQNCDDTTYASSSVFTTDDPETLSYQTQGGDEPTLTWWGFVCDDEAACSAGTSGDTAINLSTPADSGIKLRGDIKVRGGTWKINYNDIKHLLFMGFLAPLAFMVRKKD
jgi:hypothetical protein